MPWNILDYELTSARDIDCRYRYCEQEVLGSQRVDVSDQVSRYKIVTYKGPLWRKDHAILSENIDAWVCTEECIFIRAILNDGVLRRVYTLAVMCHGWLNCILYMTVRNVILYHDTITYSA